MTSAPTLQLIVNPGRMDERVFELPEGSVTIGRTQESSLCVFHGSLSRRHARLERQGEQVLLEDLQSKNGTFVDEVRVERCLLRAGQSFRCGEVLFTLMTPRVRPRELTPSQVQSLRTRLSPGSMGELLAEDQASPRSVLKVRHSSQEGRASEKLQVLLKVSQLLSSPGHIEALLERIVELVFQIMAVDRVALLLVDPETGALRPRVARRANGEEPSGPFYSQRICLLYTSDAADE